MTQEQPVLTADLVQCSGCEAMAQGVPLHALPDGWDALRVPGYLAMVFCDACVGSGRMEEVRARQGLPRRQRWRYPGAILAVYRPQAREVLIATPDGLAELSEGEARRLHAALGSALAVPDLAATLAEGAHR